MFCNSAQNVKDIGRFFIPDWAFKQQAVKPLILSESSSEINSKIPSKFTVDVKSPSSCIQKAVGPDIISRLVKVSKRWSYL